MIHLRTLIFGALLIASGSALAGNRNASMSTDMPLSRTEALKAVDYSDADKRLAAIERLAEVGTMADVGKLVPRLRDDDENVRDLAVAAIEQIWGRSGDPEIDVLYQQGLMQMRTGSYDDALTTFTEIVRRKPAFAEGWNKRATILFMAGEHRQSLRDCDEVVKRNPHHFGALSGMARIHIILGHPEHALEAYERAVKINPNLPEAETNLKALRNAVREKRQKIV